MAYIFAGWDFARFSAATQFSISVTPSGGGAQLITNTTDTFAHQDLSDVMGAGEYTSFGAWLEAELDALVPSRTYTVTWDPTTTLYTIGVDSGTFNVAFNTARSRQILGFSGNISGAASYSGTRTPYYMLALAREGLSKYSRPFEREGQTKRAVSVNANAYSIGPVTYEQGVKGTIRFQTLASVFRGEAPTSAPWTYEALVQHVRCHEPVMLAIGPSSSPTEKLVCKFTRGEFDEAARTPVWSDYHGKWDLPLDLQYLGEVS